MVGYEKNARFTLQHSNKIVQTGTLFLTLPAFTLNLSITRRYIESAVKKWLAVASIENISIIKSCCSEQVLMYKNTMYEQKNRDQGFSRLESSTEFPE